MVQQGLALFGSSQVAAMSVVRAPVIRAGALRPYQQTAVARITEELASNQSTLLVMATGTGKTRVFGEIAHRHAGRVLVLAHRKELIDQARARIHEITGEHVGIERAERSSYGERIVAASKDSLHETRLKAFKPTDFSLVIVDEAHHAIAKTYRSIIEYFSAAKVLGVTATPDRLDERALGQVFESVAYVYEIMDGITDGFLCPIVGDHCDIDAFDLSDLKANGPGGDLGDGQLGEKLADDKVMKAICEQTIAKAGDRRTLLFFPTVETAHIAAELLNTMRPASARAVDGKTAEDTRSDIFKGHRSGAYQYLCNVGVATEGYDDPQISCVGIGRPTKSRALYAQMVGRGTRIADGKIDCKILDYVNNAGRHELMGPEDLLGGKYDDETIDLAKELTRKNGGRADENLALAAAQIAQQRKEAALRAAKQKAAKTKWTEFDPFASLGLRAPEQGGAMARYDVPATDKQRAWLEAQKVIASGQELSKREASKLCNAMAARREAGLATMKQVRRLSQYAIPAQRMYFSTASELLSAIADNNWRRPDQASVEAIIARGRNREPGQEG
jgi:superfamily II DNA or RNA helicase